MYVNFAKIFTFLLAILLKFNLILIQNVFENNLAKIEGGAIKWQEIEPVFQNNTFTNNSAIYGSEIAAFPFKIEFEGELTSTNETICLNPPSNCYISLLDLPSGSMINFPLVFTIKDIYNKTLLNLNEGFHFYNSHKKN